MAYASSFHYVNDDLLEEQQSEWDFKATVAQIQTVFLLLHGRQILCSCKLCAHRMFSGLSKSSLTPNIIRFRAAPIPI